MEYGYSNDRLTRITHNGFNYGFGYDEFGKTRLVAVAGSSIVSYEYEENNGELLKTKYANGDYLRCEYDTQGRLVKEYYYSAASQKEQLLHYYVYDREGNLYRATDYASGKTYRMSYDFLDRLMRVRDEKGNAYQYTYDANNNMIRLRHEADGMNRTSAYTYDKDSREIKTTLGAITRNTAYDAWGRVKTQDWKDGENQIFRVSYEYPDSGKNIISLPTAIVNGGSRTEHTYDNNGNITSIKEGGKTVTYTYDGMNRLTRENNELLNRTVTYYYDEGNNLREEREYDYTTESLSGTPKKLTTAVMDEKWKDKLLKWGSTEMTYDACGNMLKKGNTSFTWTQGRKLSEISNGKSIRYYYDHTGARVKKVVDGVTTEYRMAGNLIVSERTGDETIWYQYDSAARLVAMVLGGVRYNYVRNAQNDIIGLIDKNGKRVVSYKYDSWGKTISTTGTLAATIGKKNPFRYRGYYFDAESGMYYLQSRYYDPEIRRFISMDSVLAAKKLVEMDVFSYCGNNPIGYLDDSGHGRTYVIYYNREETGFTDQAMNSIAYDTEDENVHMIGVKKSQEFIDAWNGMEEPIDYVYLYLHGETGKLCFRDADMEVDGTCSFDSLNSKQVDKEVFLFSCHGGAGGIEQNVAAALVEKTKSTVVACTGSVSYLKIFGKYIPRKGFSFGAWGMFFYMSIAGNPQIIGMIGRGFRIY